MPNRPDLIAQLEKLTPTEGKWEKDMWNYLRINGKIAFEPHGTNPNTYNDDVDLVKLAPAMRIAILDMAKEIEDIRNALQLRLNLIQSETSEIVRETMIQNLLLDI